MKRLSVLLVIVFLLNFLIVGNVFADNICKISANFTPSNPNPGKEIKITVSAKDITEGISAVSFTLDYDSSIFEFTGVEKMGGWTISQTESSYSMITDDYNATTKSGDIGVIKLKVKDDAKAGNTSIKLTSIEVAKDDASIISIDDISQNITIEEVNIEPSKETKTTSQENTVDSTKNTKQNTTKTTNTVSKNDTKQNQKSVNSKETKNTKSKNMVLPNTGNIIKGVSIAIILLLVTVFSVFSYRKYFKYKNM